MDVIDYVKTGLIALMDGIEAYVPPFSIINFTVHHNVDDEGMQGTLLLKPIDELVGLLDKSSDNESDFRRLCLLAMQRLDELGLIPDAGEIRFVPNQKAKALLVVFLPIRSVEEFYETLPVSFRIPVEAKHTTDEFWQEYHQKLNEDYEWQDWVKEIFGELNTRDAWLVNRALTCEVVL